MQYLISVIDHRTGSATDEEMTAIDAFNEQLVADGHWVFAGGLSAPSDATVIDARGDGQPIFTDGPFLESKEYLAGFSRARRTTRPSSWRATRPKPPT